MPYDETLYRWRRRGKRKAKRLTAEERKGHSPLRRRELNRNRRALYGVTVTSTPYNPDHHPQDLINWFRARYDEIELPIGFETKQGEIKFVQPPATPPSFAGYALENQCSVRTLRDWCKQHPDFEEAWHICEAIQEEALVRLGANGAHNANFATLMIKNRGHWTDKGEVTHKGGVTIVVDSQDEEA